MNRLRLALALAFVALAAALIGALGPAERVRTTYSWPPRALPAESPASAWYTPLLLVREQPDEIGARIPCALPDGLAAAETPVTVLATARFPERVSGLSVVRSGDRLLVRLGGEVLSQVRVPSAAAADDACSYSLRLHDQRWSIEGGPDDVAEEGELAAMPIVYGLFSELDLRSTAAPSIDVTTSVHATRVTTRQTVAWIVALLCAIGGLLLVSVDGGARRAGATTTVAVRAALAGSRPVDAVVGVALLGWWVLSPAYFDDGWVLARQSMFSSSRGFSNYFNSFAANQPLSYWLEWIQHWLAQSSSALLVLRVPSLLCLAAVWILCRWVLARALRDHPGSESLALWTLAAIFLTNTFSWGMTLRPEPQLALLVTGVLACTVRFLERESAAPLALAGVLMALALSTHPAGIVFAAPLLVAGPTVFRWARSRLVVAGTIATASSALLVTLAIIGSDLAQRRLDAETARVVGDAVVSWREELFRYTLLYAQDFGPPLRRESVGIMALAIVAYITRARRARQVLLDLSTPALAVALVLLITTPSKWPWHFGALIGLGAVAVAAETVRLREDARASRGWSVRPLLVLGVAVAASAWPWTPRERWNVLDLRSLSWVHPTESATLNVPKVVALVPLVLLVIASLAVLVRGRRLHVREVTWRVASWTAPALVVPVLAFTVVILVADAVKTEGWTLTRQNLETLGGDFGCGLADGAVVPATPSMRALTPRPDVGTATPAWVSQPPMEGLPRYALDLVDGKLVARTPWFDVPREARIGLFISGRPASGRLELEWSGAREGRTEILGSSEIDAALAEESTGLVQWSFLPASELPSRPDDAQAVRVVLRNDAPSPTAVAVTAPVTYDSEPLGPRLEQSSRSLVPPHLLTYVPCAELPKLRGGAVEVPEQIVGTRNILFPIFGRPAAPFDGIFDLYHLERLPLADSRDPLGDIVLYEVDRTIPGAVVAPPDATTFVS